MSASAILKLQSAGFTLEQVTALADLIDTQAASKTDVLEAKHEVKIEISELKAELIQFKSEVKGEIQGLKDELIETEKRLDLKIMAAKDELRKEIDALRKEIESLRNDFIDLRGHFKLQQWMFGLMLSILVAIALKIFLHP